MPSLFGFAEPLTLASAELMPSLFGEAEPLLRLLQLRRSRCLRSFASVKPPLLRSLRRSRCERKSEGKVSMSLHCMRSLLFGFAEPLLCFSASSNRFFAFRRSRTASFLFGYLALPNRTTSLLFGYSALPNRTASLLFGEAELLLCFFTLSLTRSVCEGAKRRSEGSKVVCFSFASDLLCEKAEKEQSRFIRKSK
uniref:Uncharacterized protein n=1 Tax=Hydrodictyon reticulatum TaxID=3107 RepID=A0A1W5RMX2_HYDRE|nr:hypothetical protein [Hydrodictyon reticulatum]AQU64546.1 hypothetical protein [Hydrodictyon reticulatum]